MRSTDSYIQKKLILPLYINQTGRVEYDEMNCADSFQLNQWTYLHFLYSPIDKPPVILLHNIHYLIHALIFGVLSTIIMYQL